MGFMLIEFVFLEGAKIETNVVLMCCRDKTYLQSSVIKIIDLFREG